MTALSFYDSIRSAIKPPDLMIYLKCSIRTTRKRIKLRGRKMEQNMPLSYLKRLESLYQNWISSYDKSQLLVIETDQLDYVNDLIDQIELMQSIEALLPKDLARN